MPGNASGSTGPRLPDAMEALRPVLNACTDAVALVAPDGRIAWSNAAFDSLAGGAPPKNPLLSEALPVWSGKPCSGRYEYRSAGQTVKLEATVCDAAGFTCVVLRDVTRIEEAAAEIAGHEGLLMLAMEDMKRIYDDLLTAQSRLMQADKLAAIGLISAGIIHEINNPLTCVTGTITILRDTSRRFQQIADAQAHLKKAAAAGDAAATAEALKRCAEAERGSNFDYVLRESPELLEASWKGLESIQRIIQSLKTFSRADRGIRQPEELHAVVDGVLDIVWNQIKYKAKVVKEYGELPKVVCNAQQLSQVFMNLFMNASHAIETEGVITIRSYLEGEAACIDVSDTGCGIPPENIGKIFDPFFTTKDAGKGTGLGLSISADIMKKHDGKLTVQSTVGQGTRFTVSLPLNPPAH